MPHAIVAAIAAAGAAAAGTGAAAAPAAATAGTAAAGAAAGAAAAGAIGGGAAAGTAAAGTLLGSTTLASIYGTGATGAAGLVTDVGSVLSGGSSILAAQKQAGAMKAQAKLEQQQAAQERGAGNVKANLQAEGARREIAGSIAAYSASGVKATSGSALSTIHENIRQAQADSMYTRMVAGLDSSNLLGQANLDKTQAGQARTAGLINAGTSILANAKSPLLQGA